MQIICIPDYWKENECCVYTGIQREDIVYEKGDININV